MSTNTSNKKDRLVKYGVLIMSILFIYGGWQRNEVTIVFRKAVNICLECIGIG